MGKRFVERRLKQTSARLRGLRDDLGVIDEQLVQVSDEAEDLATRSLVSESPGDGYEHRHAQAHADTMAAHRLHICDKIAELERRQDLLLDQLSGS